MQLSPPHSDCEIISQHDSSLGSRNTQSESDESSRTTTIVDELDRQTILEQLENISKQKRINKMKNNWFHEYLVEHFTRKQVIFSSEMVEILESLFIGDIYCKPSAQFTYVACIMMEK